MSTVWRLPQRPSPLRTLGWYLLPGLRAHPWLSLGIVASLGVAGVARGAEVWSLKQMVEVLTGPGPAIERLTASLLWIGLIGTAQLTARLLGVLQGLWRSRLEFAIVLTHRSQLLQVAAAAPLPAMEEPEFQDALQRSGEAGGAMGSALRFLLAASTELVAFFSFLAVTAVIHPLLPFLLGLSILPSIAMRWATGVDYQTLLDHRTIDHRRLDYLGSLPLDKGVFAEMSLFRFQGFLLHRWTALSARLRRERLRRIGRHQAWAFLVNFAVVAAVVLGFWLGVRGVAAGLFSFGAFVAGMEALSRSSGQAQNAVNLLGLLQRDLLSLSNVYRVAKMAGPHLHGEEGASSPMRCAERITEIRFEDVSFTYPGQTTPALTDLNLVFRTGERVALVGPNGAGKSTLVALLLGLYQPSKGRILIDGVDRNDLPPDRRRLLATAVFQNVVHYPLTVKDQLEFFGPPQPEEVLRSALQAAGLSEWARDWPARLHQRIGKLFSGHEPSGGQWQKLAIARALARPSSVVVVDEPTASLDPRAEVEVLRSCLAAASDRVFVMISHRLGICTLADRVLVLKEGRVVEDGTHSALAAGTGPYASMWEAQAVWYRETPPGRWHRSSPDIWADLRPSSD